MMIDNIRSFEDRNPCLSYGVYEKETLHSVPKILYVSSHCNEPGRTHINLQYIQNEDTSHYALIKNFN